jgi:hypothetical protein
MYYFVQQDVLRLIDMAPLPRLMRSASAEGFLRSIVLSGEELDSMLKRYPNVQYEPLDFFYVCVRNLAALSEELVHDLSRHYGWRGIVWAAFLVSLSPSSACRDILVTARESAPHNQWILDLAIAEIDGSPCVGLESHHELIRRLRDLVRGMTRPTVFLRRAPTAAEAAILNEQALSIRHQYQQGGSAAALKALKSSMWPRFR